MSRLELYASPFGNAYTVRDLQSDFSKSIKTSAQVIACFKTVESKVESVRGGVGSLSGSLAHLQSRIQEEETRLDQENEIKVKTDDLIDTALSTDAKAAVLVNKNKDEFYQKFPHLLPPPPPEEKAWYEKAWESLCAAGEALCEVVADLAEMAVKIGKALGGYAAEVLKNLPLLPFTGIAGMIKLIGPTFTALAKIGTAISNFFAKHKILHTIVIAASAVCTVAGVIVAGPLVLAPLLAAIGCSAAVAAAISTGVFVVSIVATISNAGLNLADVWLEIDNPVFNFLQTGTGVIALITDLTMGIGSFYNHFFKINPKLGVEIRTTAASGNIDDAMLRTMQDPISDTMNPKYANYVYSQTNDFSGKEYSKLKLWEKYRAKIAQREYAKTVPHTNQWYLKNLQEGVRTYHNNRYPGIKPYGFKKAKIGTPKSIMKGFKVYSKESGINVYYHSTQWNNPKSTIFHRNPHLTPDVPVTNPTIGWKAHIQNYDKVMDVHGDLIPFFDDKIIFEKGQNGTLISSINSTDYLQLNFYNGKKLTPTELTEVTRDLNGIQALIRNNGTVSKNGSRQMASIIAKYLMPQIHIPVLDIPTMWPI